MEILLDNGAELDSKDINGHTAVMHAAIKGQIEALRILLDRNPVLGVDARGNTAGDLAKYKGHSKDCEKLLGSYQNKHDEL